MKLNMVFAAIYFFLLFATASANHTDTLQGNITTTVTLQNTKIYLMLGTVSVKQGGVLVIQPGTIIKGDKNSKAALVVERGGIIYANGSAAQPIVFTSAQPIGSKAPGDWGGIILLGRARINTASGSDTASIEGIAPAVYYGGMNDADSSGVMRYCRIEYSGIALSPNNEINGLTMGGVGSRTVIENIQVSWNGDDSFEWFGGTVNCKYLVSYNCTDDDFDSDFGYRGKQQFYLAIRKPTVADVSGSTNIESDNNNGPNYNLPRTRSVISNFTFVGPKQFDTSLVNPNYTRGFHLRRNTLTSIANSILMGWQQGALFDGTGVTCALANDSMYIKSNIFAGIYSGFATTNAGCNFNGSSYINSNNTVLSATADAQLSAPYSGIISGSYSPANFVPLAGSPALSGANFTHPGLNDPFYIPVSYRGAFGPGSNWAVNWTNFRPDTIPYFTIFDGLQQISSVVPKAFKLFDNYPNPFNPATNIVFAIKIKGYVSLTVFDILGREVAVLVNENLTAGEYKINFNASNLPSGVYMYRLSVNGDKANFTDTKKLILVK